jgi:fumarate reductase flavoprotein subunit
MAPLGRSGGDVNAIREGLMDVMWEHAGIIRSREGLETGLDRLATLRGELNASGIGNQDRRFNLSWHDWLNLDNLLTVSEVICHAALAREDSRGAHFREDFPHAGELESSTFTVVQKEGDDLSVTQSPVAFTIVRPGQSLLPAEADPGRDAQ